MAKVDTGVERAPQFKIDAKGKPTTVMMDATDYIKLLISTRAHRELNRLHGEINERIKSAIASLTEDPRPDGCRKIEGATNRHYRK